MTLDETVDAIVETVVINEGLRFLRPAQRARIRVLIKRWARTHVQLTFDEEG